MDLRQAVRDRIASLGVEEAAKFFGVSTGTVSNWSTGKSSPSIDAAQMVLPEPEPVVETKIVQWEGKKVMLLLPVYRTINPETHYTLFANYARYGPEKLALDYNKGTVIHEARNLLIHKNMVQNGIETFIMVDDDMILPCGNPSYLNALHRANLPTKQASELAISRIMSHGSDKGIVGGLYVGRHAAGRAQCASAFISDQENRKFHEYVYDGLKPEDWVATGFLKIERWVIDKMKAAIDAGEFPDCKPAKPGQWYGYFTPLKVGVGEDVSFGTRAKKIGIQSYVDAGLVCGHVGDCTWYLKNTSF